MHKLKNREWPYCDEFDFFRYKKILRAKKVLTIRNISTELLPYYEQSQLMTFQYDSELSTNAMRKWQAYAYWDKQKINIALFWKLSDDSVLLLKTHPELKVLKIQKRYLLSTLSEVHLNFWQRLRMSWKLRAKMSPSKPQPPARSL